MKSGNIIEYRIKCGENIVGSFRRDSLSDVPDFSELLKYQPLEDHTIQAHGHDELDIAWYGDVENLKDFMLDIGKNSGNSVIMAYFDDNDDEVVGAVLRDGILEFRNKSGSIDSVDLSYYLNSDINRVISLIDERIVYYSDDGKSSSISEYVINSMMVEELKLIRGMVEDLMDKGS